MPRLGVGAELVGGLCRGRAAAIGSMMVLSSLGVRLFQGHASGALNRPFVVLLE